MPGHKENTGLFLGDALKYDVTEVDGLDNLHEAESVIRGSERFAAGLYKSEETHFLINGSTAGILSAVFASTVPGDEILIARNCHISVYNAAEQNRLKIRYIYPEISDKYGLCTCINAEDFAGMLKKYPGIKAAVITSPTYEGVCSDIRSIAKAAHECNVVLIVDAAHGAHFGFDEGFPSSAVSDGADIVINSVHKTLPAPTQTALIHINGPLADRERIRRMLRIYQSSSPSYLLMAGTDDCMSILNEQGKELFKRLRENLDGFEKRAKTLKHLKYLSPAVLCEECRAADADPCKITISTAGSGINGKELYDILRTKYHIQPEMASPGHCLLIVTIMDDRKTFEKIINALECIDEKLSEVKKDNDTAVRNLYAVKPKQVMQPYEAMSSMSIETDLGDAAGSVSADYLKIYPPGIPMIVPGERITREFTGILKNVRNAGFSVQGIGADNRIKVIR